PPKAKPRDPDKDKDRIAELERERDKLLKQVADLQKQLDTLRERLDALNPAGKADPFNPPLPARGGAGLPPPSPGDAGPSPLRPLPPPHPLDGKSPDLPTPAPGGSNRPTLGPTPTGPADGKAGVVSKVYSVEDLASDEKQAESLMRIIRRAVEPASW